ncbi:trehalose-phosphatase [Novosphingobium panipatense]|uniref:Trehalose 6-phosphate phosphatase n=1 Tax=Novosphingobium panipatense TaxID=428991 RepID=A0ABY1QBR3_9SPHN|nr:trehalose-phosphatase [Novosphingobium panipatense]SMP66437.1 trehalose 6-phosphate phosphatase [Novosphingobium panipatense]
MTSSSDGPSPAAHRVSGDSAGRALEMPSPLSLAGTALFLDFDGTLVEIAEHPDDVRVSPRLRGLVEELSRALDDRLAIVTGRSIAALESLLGPVEVALAGSHGGEFRPGGGQPTEPLASPLPGAVVGALQAFSERHGGLLVEPKPFSAAVHYRHHPEARDALLLQAQELAATFDLEVKHGKQVVEVTMPGSDKGSAVARFMQLPHFREARPTFLGDDVTDEDAFHVARDLGGRGILVGAPRPTAASFRLDSVTAVHAWLETGLHAAAFKGEPPR